MNITTTSIDKIKHNLTSFIVNVRIEVEPNNVLHTSPD